MSEVVPINFQSGLDTKTDPNQVAIGQFLVLKNSVFTTTKRLTKRNGFAGLPNLPGNASYLTTFNNNLTAIGNSIYAYSADTQSWVTKGNYYPLELSTLPLIRNNLNQTQCDSVIAPNGLICTVYSELNNSTTTYKYVIADSVTGQNFVAPTIIPVSSGVVTGSPRVFLNGNYFVIVFTNVIAGASHLQFIAVSTSNPIIVTANTDIASLYISATTVSWDGIVFNNKLFIAYNTTAGGQSIKVVFLDQHLVLSATTTLVGAKATMMTLCADISSSFVYVSFYDLSSTTGYTAVIDQNLNIVMAPVQIIASGTILNLASQAQNGTCTVFSEVSNVYSYDGGIASNYINGVSITPLGTSFHSIFSSGAGTITASSATGLVNGMYVVDNTVAARIPAGTTFTISGTTLTLSNNTAGNSASSPGDVLAVATVSSVTTIIRSVGLASKAFIVDGQIYFLTAYKSPFQPTYFLINGSLSLSSSPVIVMKLAYENGGGYLTHGLPGVSFLGEFAYIPYLFKDLVQALSTNNNTQQTTSGGVYSQTGINLVSFEINSQNIDSVEIGSNLNISGGFGWMYDGYLPVEQSFFIWPDSIELTTATSGGHLSDQAYYYQVTYEWSDNQGNIFRSAPSIPVTITTSGGGNSANTINVPYLRLTLKTANPVKIVIYRWSTAQPIYYQITSITAPQLNDTTSDSLAFVDTLSDATISGNNIIYTTGGVLEDVNPPASNILTTFDTRPWLVDAEDQNLLWDAKQVIESTPVEWSDLLTQFVAPNTGTTQSTGPIKAMAPMDDKICLFKTDAIYYINGTGPNITGANNQYSQAIFITSSVGCANQKSLVLIPQGLMFQSDKGIWLLARDLSTTYIGAPVEAFNNSIVTSAVNVPATTQVRFTLSTGEMLMYDYYYNQWGEFTGVPAISSCIFQGVHTFINSNGQVFQETKDTYLDGSNPVLLGFTTGWINLASLQGYQRFVDFYILAQYLSPHILNCSVAYDYNPSPLNFTRIQPNNFSSSIPAPYGVPVPFGAHFNKEQWRVYAKKQTCQAFQLTIQEVFDPQFGTVPGAGFTMSGISARILTKANKRPFAAATSSGAKG